MSANGFNSFQQTGLSNGIAPVQMTTPTGNFANQTLTVQPTTVNSSPINIGFVRGKMGVSTFPIMSSNTTVYLFDVQDQSRFYVKATDAFGMAMPIREFEYHEIVQQPVMPEIFPSALTNNDEKNIDNHSTDTDMVTKKEFEDLKAQLSTLIQQIQNNKQQYNKPRREKTDNV
jgi:hypothetical protein